MFTIRRHTARRAGGVAILWSTLLVGIGSALALESPQEAAISGIVFDRVTGGGIQDATVLLIALDGRLRASERTDPRGRFVFSPLKLGDYVVTATKDGYGDGAFGRLSSAIMGSTTVRLAEGEWFDHAHVHLPKLSAIVGRVSDEDQLPVAGVYVRALSRRLINAADTVVGGTTSLTDDRGEFRIGQLHPAQYTVLVPRWRSIGSAGHSSGVDPKGGGDTYPTMYLGDSDNLEGASWLDLQAGGAEVRADIQLEPRKRFSIIGKISDAGAAGSPLTVRLFEERQTFRGSGSEAGIAVASKRGDFVFPAVAPGDYSIEVMLNESEFAIPAPRGTVFYGASMPRLPGAGASITELVAGSPNTQFTSRPAVQRQHWARQHVSVRDDDQVVVTLHLQPAASVHATVEIRSVESPDTEKLLPFRFVAESVGTTKVTIRSRPSVDVPSVHRFDGLVPGKYLLRSDVRGWAVTGVKLRGSPITAPVVDVGATDLDDLVIVTSRATAELQGRVAQNTRPGEWSALIIPQDPALRVDLLIAPGLVRVARLTTKGTFAISDLTSGAYFVAILPAAVAEGSWSPPLFDQTAAVGTPLTLGEGERKQLLLRYVEMVR